MANTLPTLKERTIIEIDFYGYKLNCRRINIDDYDNAAGVVEGAKAFLDPNLMWIAYLMVDYQDEKTGIELTKEEKVAWLKKIDIGEDTPMDAVEKTNAILEKLGLPKKEELEDESKKKSQTEVQGTSGE
jgi:hypothetical protein